MMTESPSALTQRAHMRWFLVLFVWPSLAVTWAVLGLMGNPILHETGWLAGLLMVGWAVTLVAKRQQLRATGLLGSRAMDARPR